MDQAVLMSLILVILVIVIVFFFDIITPIYTKIAFDSICREYAVIIAAEGSLTETEKDEMTKEIRDKNISNISFSIEEASVLKQKEIIHVSVSGDYESHKFSSLFKRELEILEFSFDQNVRYRKITN